MNLSPLYRTARAFLSALFPLALCAGLLCWPEVVAEAATDGLCLCGTLILPSLFPFFVLSGLTVSLGVSALLGRMISPVMEPLFHQNGAGASALVLGLVGGYPVGARTVCELYRKGQCDREQAQRLLAFCNNSGPAFVIGAAGMAVFQSARTGFLLMGIQLLSACLVGILLRPGQRQAPAAQASDAAPKSFTRCFTESVGQAATATLHICAYVIVFNILIQLLRCSGLLPLLEGLLGWLRCPESWRTGLVNGTLELSNGIAALRHTPDTIIPASFLLSWGGLSVHCQTLSLLQQQGLGAEQYLLGKTLQAGISAALACLALGLWPAALTTVQVSSVVLPASIWLPAAGHWTLLFSLPLWGGLTLGTALVIRRKRAGNHPVSRV